MIHTTPWSGWLFFFISFALVFASPSIRKDKALLYTLLLLVGLHQVVAIIDNYFFNVIGSGVDTKTFYVHAVRWTQNDKTWQLAFNSRVYRQLLGTVFQVFGPSMFLAAQTSIIAFTVSALVFTKILDTLKLQHYRILLTLAYGCIGSTLIFTSIILREAFQLMFFVLAVYWLIKWHQQLSIKSLLLILFSAFGLSLFHDGLVLYSFLIIPTLVLWPIVLQQLVKQPITTAKCAIPTYIALVSIFILLAIAFYTIAHMDLEGSGIIQAIGQFKLGHFIYGYRYGLFADSIHSRALYGIRLATPSLIDFVRHIPVLLTAYLFAPLPNHLTTYVDLYAGFEALVRGILLTSTLITLFRLRNNAQRSIHLMLLFAYATMALLWASGTDNYGTAIRHNIVHSWLLLLTGGPFILDQLASLWDYVLNIVAQFKRSDSLETG